MLTWFANKAWNAALDSARVNHVQTSAVLWQAAATFLAAHPNPDEENLQSRKACMGSDSSVYAISSMSSTACMAWSHRPTKSTCLLSSTTTVAISICPIKI